MLVEIQLNRVPGGRVGRRVAVGFAEGRRVDGLERVQPDEGAEEEHGIALEKNGRVHATFSSFI